MDDGRSMRALKASLATPLGEMRNRAGPRQGSWHVSACQVGGRVRKLRAVGGHLARPVWLVSLVPPVSHVPRQRNYARGEGRPRPLLKK